MSRPRFRVLLVHDEPRLLEIFGQAARSSGGELATAGSYAAAVQRVASERFDAVVISPGLANFSRQGFARVVRNSRLNSQSGVVLLTGSRGRGSDAPEAGGISMLPRPFHPDDLVPFFKQLTRAFQAERRGQRRLSFRASVKCVKGLERFQAISLNLGITGMLLDVPTPLRLNEELELHFNLELSGPALGTRGRVVRAVSPTRVGVVFQGLLAQDRQRIRLFIDQHLPERT
jgi:DNA-binding response OmpR family regulator